MAVQIQQLPDDDQLRKARGAFFTPGALAEFLAAWAVRGAQDRVLDPSCGEAALLLKAGLRLRSLGGEPALAGFDLHAPSIDAARRILKAEALASDLRAADFFEAAPNREFDVVIGNPPYVRYQSFSGTDRMNGQRVASAQGVKLSGLANAWAAFVVHAAAFLVPGGRLALILPGALLSVNYAAPVRQFLLRRFGSVSLVMFEERVFPEVQEEVVLLLAEGEGPAARLDVFQVRDVGGLNDIGGLPPERGGFWKPSDESDKWTRALLPALARETYERTVDGACFTSLLGWGETDLGIVTGNNKFFTLTRAEVDRLRLPPAELRPVPPSGSQYVRGLAFTAASFDELERAGHRVFLFYPTATRPSAAALRYIRLGEQQGVHEAFKCATRTPWWRVPRARVPDLYLTYLNRDAPRFVANDMRATHLNSIHGITLKPEHRGLGIEMLPLAMLNSVTLLSAELVGRSYGGGILKVEPKEADRLAAPSPRVLEAASGRLRLLRRGITKDPPRYSLTDIVTAVDEILAPHVGLDPNGLSILAQARTSLAARRTARERPAATGITDGTTALPRRRGPPTGVATR